MTAAQSNFEYRVGGSLESNAPSYVTRQADSAFYEGLKAGEFCYVLNSRQMGKSSLRVRVMQRLQAEGTVCAFVDLTGMGTQEVTAEKWYAGIAQSLVSSCQLSERIQWRTWWRERRDLLSPVQRLSLFIENVLLVEISQKIVIFIDEIDRVLSQNFCLDDFFALIRYFYQQRHLNPAYQRLTIALLGVATPSELIRNKRQTPFNIGRAIALQGFQWHEVQPLLEGLRGKVDDPKSTLREILDWTGGQPFLTQKLCHLIACESQKGRVLRVAQVVRSRLLDNWESQDEPEHLRTIRDRLLRNQQRSGRLLGLYRTLLQQGEMAADGSPEQVELRLSGLVVERQGKLQVYNPIYAAVFNAAWVDRQLAALRPYASAIAAWLASQGQDSSHLLQGQALQDALGWALGKSLSDWDYQFLGASQDLAKRQAQTALEIAEQASHLLATARQQARQDAQKQRLAWGWIPAIAVGVSVPIVLLRLGGLLQGTEWAMLDQFVRWRTLEPLETRIALIAIDEADLNWLGHWPIPDRILAQAIARINRQHPRAIGLDLYRDLPVEPGQQQLAELFRTTPNLFGIEKVVEPRIAPPPILKQLGRVGFADQVLDADGRLRRALLSVMDAGNEVHYSLATQLALRYLAAEGIRLEATDSKEQRLRLGKAVFERFQANDGGYVRAQSGGYQLLLNFRGSQAAFPSWSLRDVLENRIPPKSLRDRLVLIGTTAESLNDFFYTPYSSSLFHSPQRMAGVVIHANISSAIIRAALQGRPLFRVWSDPLEGLWILAWAGVGTIICWGLKSPAAIAASLALAGAGLVGGCYWAFLQGWWLPVIPACLALGGAAIALPLTVQKHRDRLVLRHTLASLIAAYANEPAAARIAIEYLKQSESPANQAWIASFMAQ